MFYKHDMSGYHSPIDGVQQKTLVYGKNTLMTEFLLEKDADLPVHDHPHEQTGYLVSGKLKMIIDGKEFIAEAGDCWCIGGKVRHGAVAIMDSVVVEIFSPVRIEYIP